MSARSNANLMPLFMTEFLFSLKKSRATHTMQKSLRDSGVILLGKGCKCFNDLSLVAELTKTSCSRIINPEKAQRTHNLRVKLD